MPSLYLEFSIGKKFPDRFKLPLRFFRFQRHKCIALSGLLFLHLLPRPPFRSQAPFTTAWAIYFQTFGPFFVFLLLSYGVIFRSPHLRSKRGDLNSYKLSREAKKQYKKLERSGLRKPSIIDAIDALAIDLEANGPELFQWPNYGLIHEAKNTFYYHCHLRKGHPTMVACWRADEKEKNIEVFYVGSHEKAPYQK
ncbi:MAG: hypothetical protein K940chlam7_00260 [Chlamydiae bacterium]|nr:hypothetical protein [Chlamydiota bacterium]